MNNDLISRQVAIDALGNEPEVWSGKDEYEQGLNNQWHYDVNALKVVPSADVSSRWISVTERLPEKYGKYLVTVDMDYYVAVITLYYGRINCKDVFYDSDSEYGDIEYRGVIAWMPLPEPYKKGE